MSARSELREIWQANRWTRRWLWCALAVAANVVRGFLWPTPDWDWLPALLLAVATVGCGFMQGRTAGKLRVARKAQEERVAAESAKLRQLHAPDATAGQCPVCGMDDLDRLAADDRLMDRGPFAKVVAYGRRRAHWECAEFVPYVPTADERKAETHRREHRAGHRDSACDWCFTEDIRWEREEARRSFERSWPELMESAAAGDRQIRLTRQADPRFRHWLINEGAPKRHMDILTVESCEKARDGHGWTAILAEPLRHGLFVTLNTPQRMMPLDSDRMWNREAGRPYTRAELGLCDCGQPATSGKLRASIDADTIAALFAEVNDRPEHMSAANSWLLKDKGWRK